MHPAPKPARAGSPSRFKTRLQRSPGPKACVLAGTGCALCSGVPASQPTFRGRLAAARNAWTSAGPSGAPGSPETDPEARSIVERLPERWPRAERPRGCGAAAGLQRVSGRPRRAGADLVRIGWLPMCPTVVVSRAALVGCSFGSSHARWRPSWFTTSPFLSPTLGRDATFSIKVPARPRASGPSLAVSWETVGRSPSKTAPCNSSVLTAPSWAAFSVWLSTDHYSVTTGTP